MVYPIKLQWSPYEPSLDNLPCLLTYADKTGGSQFSMTMLAHLCIAWSKAVVLTAYPMAKENFLWQIAGEAITIWHITSSDDIATQKTKDVIFIESGHDELFLTVLQELTDIQERIIFLKNFEIFSPETITVCLWYTKLILSGNIDNCTIPEKVVAKKYNTIITFSEPAFKLPITYHPQEKYCWYIEWPNVQWTIMIDNSL